MNNKITNLTFSEILDSLRYSSRRITAPTIKDTDPKSLIHRFCCVCESLGSDTIARPVSIPPEYRHYWQEFLSGRRQILDRRTLRYLCWEPDIVITTQFIDHVYDKGLETSHRSIQGLVRACHRRWATLLNYSALKRTKIIDRIAGVIKNYEGSNKIVLKWKSDLDTVLSINGPESFASRMVSDRKTIKEYVDAWGLDHDSEYLVYAISLVLNGCKQHIFSDNDKLEYLFKVVLPWERWDIVSFKREIGKLILDDRMQNSEAVRERLKKFALSDERLGDPRLPRNKKQWYDMSRDAHERFIQWLSQADIAFFFEHVLPKGKDPHGRKDFWLRYVKKLRASRPMLCFEDEERLKPIMLKHRDSVGHFGKIYTQNSVFLLDFGDLVAVEFSKVGACHVYVSSVFKQIFPDFWSMKSFKESQFKDKKRLSRVVHMSLWKWNISNLLSKYGIRPS